MILLMPDHGETVDLPDDASYETVRQRIDNMFSSTSCDYVVVGTRTVSASECCDDQFAIRRDRRTSAVMEDLRQRVLAHVAYENPLADVPGVVAKPSPDKHPTLDVSIMEIIEAYPYHQACALDSIMRGDIGKAVDHLLRWEMLQKKMR